jgi:two-component system response regulator FixJ
VTAEREIIVIDDDPAVRAALKALLTTKGYAVEMFASAEAFLADSSWGGAACLLVDVRMPGMSGLDLQRELRKRGSVLPIVVITGHGDVPLAVAALKAGAVDFLEKPFDSDALLAAIDEGFRRMASTGGFDRAETAARVARLTAREREVMDLVVQGMPNKVIADRLDVAIRTVEVHRSRVMEKTGARNLSELVRMAIALEQTP